MSVPVTFNGVIYQVPTQGDINWAPPLTRYLVALAAGAITPSGGSYPLTADLNFGTNFGLVAPYYKSSSANISTVGVLRLSNTDSIGWRNFAHNGDLLLTVNSSNDLIFNGVSLSGGITQLTGDVTATGPGSVPATLATVNASVGSFTSANITVNAKGLITAATNGAGGGTVTSVAQTVPAFLSVAGSPITTSGTLAITFSGTALPVINGGTGTTTSTGTTNVVLSNSPTLVTPILGVASATSLSFSSTSGIIGTTTNNNAATGSVGEYIDSVVVAVNYPTTNQYGDLTSISLTAGDWDVWAQVDTDQNGSTWTNMFTGISITSGNSATGLVTGDSLINQTWASSSTTPAAVYETVRIRMSLSTTTTVYLKFRAIYSAGQPQTLGGKLAARRVR